MGNEITSIEVIGSGCVNCKKLYELVVVAVRELNLGVEAGYSNDVQKALTMGVMQFPVLAINGRAALTGLADLVKVKKVLVEQNGEADVSGCCPCGGDCGCL